MLFETFRKFREERPDDPAFLVSLGDRSLPITWKKFTNDIAAVAWVIRKHAPGSTIALLGENSYEWVVAHAACLFAGATAVSVGTASFVDPLTAPRVVRGIRDYMARHGLRRVADIAIPR